MERKARPTKKNFNQEESKPFNKNFYGKKVETNVGVNKNKTVKKWQPNDDLNEEVNIDDLANDSNKKYNKRFSESKNFSSKPTTDVTKNKTSYERTDERRSTSKPRFNSDLKSKKESYSSDFEKDTTRSAKNKTYKEYKSGGTKKSNAESDGYQETAFNSRRSIYDQEESTPKKSNKPTFNTKFKTEKKGPSKPRVVKDPNDDSIRLNKFISNAGICSRREADELIKAGAVTVNGKVITEMGYKIQKTDLVNYGGQGLKPERQVYILLNKPKDYITTSEDPQERRTVLELIKGACKERVYPVGRLDRNTTGLLLLTNDGELTDKITHPSFKQKKIYHVELDKPVKKEHLKAIEAGIELEDGPIKVDEINYVENSESKKEIGITLHSGRNRIVRRIFEHFDYRVKKLDRVYFAGLTKKDLARGRWRFLTPMEVNMLKMVH